MFNFKTNKMSKLSLDALKERAEATASNELLATISGGTENACHDSTPQNPSSYDYVPSGNPIWDTVQGIMWWLGL